MVCGYKLHTQSAWWCPDPRVLPHKHGFTQLCCGEKTFFRGTGPEQAEITWPQEPTGWAFTCCWGIRGRDLNPDFPCPSCRNAGLLMLAAALLVGTEKVSSLKQGLGAFLQLRDLNTGIVSFCPTLTAAHAALGDILAT